MNSEEIMTKIQLFIDTQHLHTPYDYTAELSPTDIYLLAERILSLVQPLIDQARMEGKREVADYVTSRIIPKAVYPFTEPVMISKRQWIAKLEEWFPKP